MGILENVGLAEYPRTMEPCQNITKLMQVIRCQSNGDTKENCKNIPRLDFTYKAKKS